MRLGLIVTLFLFSAITLAADGCPPNSEPYTQSTEGGVTTVRCRCVSGYANWRGDCRLVEEVKTRLEERLKNAEAAGRAALSSWGESAQGVMLTKIHNALKSVDFLSGLSGRALGKQTYDVNAKLVDVLAGMEECDFSNADMRTSCQNVKTFQRIVRETREEMDKLPAQYGQ